MERGFPLLLCCSVTTVVSGRGLPFLLRIIQSPLGLKSCLGLSHPLRGKRSIVVRQDWHIWAKQSQKCFSCGTFKSSRSYKHYSVSFVFSGT